MFQALLTLHGRSYTFGGVNREVGGVTESRRRGERERTVIGMENEEKFKLNKKEMFKKCTGTCH